MNGRKRPRRNKSNGYITSMRLSKNGKICLEYLANRFDISVTEVVERMARQVFKQEREKELSETQKD